MTEACVLRLEKAGATPGFVEEANETLFSLCVCGSIKDLRHAHIRECMQNSFGEDTRKPRRWGFWRDGVCGKGSPLLPEQHRTQTRTVSQ